MWRICSRESPPWPATDIAKTNYILPAPESLRGWFFSRRAEEERAFAALLGRHNQGQFDGACLAGRVVETLHGFAVVLRLCKENIGDERLRIAVVQRKPTRLDLHHDAMAGQEDMVRRRQSEAVKQGLVGGDGFCRLQALAIAATEDVG